MGALALLIGCGAAQQPLAHRMAPCPPTPNCVSSLADPADSHHIPALPWRGEDGAQALEAARQAALSLSGVAVVEADDDWVHLVAITPILRFRDDVELQVDPAARVVHVRSASRVGRSDLGVNRRRVERIRARLNAAAPP